VGREASDRYGHLFIAASLGIQAALVIFFALRRWQFAVAMRWGWIVYALAVPAAALSVALVRATRPWYLWMAGFLFAAWAVFGAVVDLVRPVEWRSPILWSVFVPYVGLYTLAQMFYWWPLLKVHRPSWFVFAALYALSSTLNLASH
jgi:hypothetical protein